MFGSIRIPVLQSQIQDLENQIHSTECRNFGLLRHGLSAASSVDSYYGQFLAHTANLATQYLSQLPAHFSAGWSSLSWDSWFPSVWNPDSAAADPTLSTYSLLRIGDLVEGRQSGASGFRVPGFVPFIGMNKTIIIVTHGEVYAAGIGLLQSLLIRTALMLPHQAAYTLLDPAGNGSAFPMRRHLPVVRESSGDARRDLEKVIQDIQRINETYLDASTPSLELVAPSLRVNERFQFVFAADFPNKYDRRAIEALQSVATTGPRTGTYVFLHYNADNELPRDLNIADFKNAVQIDLTSQGSFTAAALKLAPDTAPGPVIQDAVFAKLKNAKPPERKIDWSTIAPTSEWWTESATEILSTPIGVSGASGTLSLWFGMNRDGQPCAHGMLGAMTGSGKSNLYHILILGLCVRYSPNELRLFLIDGKDGVEFQPYRDLPHAEVVSLKSSPQLSRSVLAELVAERERRNKLFATAKVSDLSQYRKSGQPGGTLPRILLLVDEYQELFEGDKDGEASHLLLQLAQQGRSAGIHMLLGSQRFGAPGMLNQAAVFGNVHLRIAMQMTSSDVQALTEFGRRGKQLISTCDLPGKIVVNDRSGDDSGNQVGKVAFLLSDQRKELIDQLIEKASGLPPKDVPITIIFDGKAQPNVIENPYVSYLTRQPAWLTPEEFERLARRPVYDEGLDIIDWFAAEHPKVAWLGQDFSVRGQARVVFRRRASENVVLIGGANAARYGMLASVIASLALNGSPAQLEFVIFDRSIPGTAWNPTLRTATDLILKPSSYQVSLFQDSTDASTVLDQILAELDRRHGLTEVRLGQEPTLFCILTELDRIDDLRRRADTYGMTETPLGQKLNRICVEGPSLGIHSVLSFSGVRPMSSVLDERRGLLHFRHRVALQMSEDESLTLVRSRKAAQLQLEGPAPICALYMDVEHDRSLRFKPYSIESTIDINDQLAAIGRRVAEWSRSL